MSSWGGYRRYKPIHNQNNLNTQNNHNTNDTQNKLIVNSSYTKQNNYIHITPPKYNSHVYDITTSYNSEEFQSSVERMDAFYLNNVNAKITFIIPSIGRSSLLNTLLSLQKQTDPEWSAIIVFDGIIPDNNILSFIKNDKRLYYIIIKKTGEEADIHNRAGYVRNIGMSLVLSDWIAFVDDDDILINDYIIHFKSEIARYNVDCILFRMYDTTINDIIPRENTIKNPIISGNIGINFCIKKSLFKSGYVFTQSDLEDFEYIKRLYNDKKKIFISSYVTYIVRGSIYDSNFKSDQGLSEVILNL